MRYLALLRRVNVGGKNKVAMQELKSAFENYGFQHVTTYINSGNIIFSHIEKTDVLQLKEICENILKHVLKVDVPISVISKDIFIDVINNAPDWWGKDSRFIHNIAFVIAPTKASVLIEKINVVQHEKIHCHGDAIFWSSPKDSFSKSGFSKIARTPSYQKITVRNANTANKLARLLETPTK